MSKHTDQNHRNFMDWLQEAVGDSAEARQAANEEGLQLNVSHALREARHAAGMTQSMVSEASGLRQSLVSRLEKPGYNPTLETIVRYLDAIGADLALTVVVDGHSFAATDAANNAVMMPVDIVRDAHGDGVSVTDHVLGILRHQITIRRVAEEIRVQLNEMRGWIQNMGPGDIGADVTHGYQIGALTDSEDDMRLTPYAAAA